MVDCIWTYSCTCMGTYIWTCMGTCKGFFYKSWCKHLQYFGGIKVEIDNKERQILVDSLNFHLNCIKANNKQKESITEFKIKQLIQKLNNS